MNEAAIRLLYRAKNQLKIRGWSRDELEDDEGRVCAIGALHMTSPWDRDERHAWWTVMTTLQELTGGSIADWNRSASQEEVERLYDTAIVKLGGWPTKWMRIEEKS